MKSKIILTLLITMLLTLKSFATAINYSNSVTDSLVIQKLNLKKQIVVHAGNKIKIWHYDRSVIKGVFKSLNQDTLTIDVNGKMHKTVISDIKKLKFYYPQLGKQILGGLSFGVGTVAMTAGAIGLASSFGSPLGSLSAVFFAPLIPIGYGIYKLGTILVRKKVNNLR